MPGLSTFTRIWLLSSVLLISACMPADGPYSDAIRAQRGLGADSIPYALVKLTSKVVESLAQYTPRIANQFTDRRPPGDIRLGTGDVVSITVFEASAGGLFIPAEASARPGNFITIPNQTVDSEGNISVPYAGTVHARGRTVTEVQRTIVDQLKNQAIKPQVVISVVDQRTSMISVLGEVNHPERFPASAAGEHLLDSITRAGGPKEQGYDTWVMLERDGRRATVPFGALVFDPSNNIFVIRTIPYMCMLNPRLLWCLGRQPARQSVRLGLVWRRLHPQAPRASTLSAPGEFRWLRRWRRRVDSMTQWLTRHRYSCTAANFGKLQKKSA